MTGESEKIAFLMGKAEDSLSAAVMLLNKNHPDFAVSRAYYGMFYATEALLQTKNLSFKKHSAVIGNFNKEFVHTGLFPKEMARKLEKAHTYRMQGDYGMIPVEPEEAGAILESADNYIENIKGFLETEGFLQK